MQLIFTKNYMFNSLIKFTHLKISLFFFAIKKNYKINDNFRIDAS
jgi:hypothetical protein